MFLPFLRLSLAHRRYLKARRAALRRSLAIAAAEQRLITRRSRA